MPGILTLLQRSVQAVLLGKSALPDWFSQGIKAAARINKFQVEALVGHHHSMYETQTKRPSFHCNLIVVYCYILLYARMWKWFLSCKYMYVWWFYIFNSLFVHEKLFESSYELIDILKYLGIFFSTTFIIAIGFLKKLDIRNVEIPWDYFDESMITSKTNIWYRI